MRRRGWEDLVDVLWQGQDVNLIDPGGEESPGLVIN